MLLRQRPMSLDDGRFFAGLEGTRTAGCSSRRGGRVEGVGAAALATPRRTSGSTSGGPDVCYTPASSIPTTNCTDAQRRARARGRPLPPLAKDDIPGRGARQLKRMLGSTRGRGAHRARRAALSGWHRDRGSGPFHYVFPAVETSGFEPRPEVRVQRASSALRGFVAMRPGGSMDLRRVRRRPSGPKSSSESLTMCLQDHRAACGAARGNDGFVQIAGRACSRFSRHGRVGSS